MKYSILFFTIILSLCAQASFFNHCDSYPSHPKSAFEKALKNLTSLNYIRHAITSELGPDIQFCTQSLKLGSSQWKDGLYFYQVLVKSSKTNLKVRTYHFLYQDASTQANHNLQNLNWTGMPASETLDIFDGLAATSYFTSNQKMNASGITLELALDSDVKLIQLLQNSILFEKGNVDLDSVAMIQISGNLFLATWQNASTNSFGENPPVFSILFNQINNTEFQIAENSFIYSDLVVPMMAAAKNAKPSQIDETLAEQHLKEISILTK